MKKIKQKQLRAVKVLRLAQGREKNRSRANFYIGHVNVYIQLEKKLIKQLNAIMESGNNICLTKGNGDGNDNWTEAGLRRSPA